MKITDYDLKHEFNIYVEYYKTEQFWWSSL